MTPLEVAVPEPEAVELLAIEPVELREVALDLVRLEQPRLELGDRLAERLGEAGEARRAPQAVQARALDRAAYEQRALEVGRQRPVPSVPARDPLEDVVERTDATAEEDAGTAQQVALDTLDVRPVRHDEDRLVLQALQVALEQQRHLPRIRRPCEQSQGHRPMLVGGPDGSEVAEEGKSGKCESPLSPTSTGTSPPSRSCSPRSSARAWTRSSSAVTSAPDRSRPRCSGA